MPATAAPPASIFEQFNWKPQPQAQRLVNDLTADFLARCPRAALLAKRMKDETGTRFIDWIDHIQAPRGWNVGPGDLRTRLLETGYDAKPEPGAPETHVNALGMFPPIVLVDGATLRVGIKVEFVADFLAAHGLHDAKVVGEPFGQFRIATVFTGDHAELLAVERHGCRGLTPPNHDAQKAIRAQKHLEGFRRRRRDFPADAEGYAEANRLVDAAIADVGRDWTCDAFFAAERDYWMRRNRAARVQYARQETLGLGWANHDHHTYRCSREHFPAHVALCEKLGLFCRERFYAGAEAMWGAQVMEQPVTGIITFNDVDMSPEELLGDFSHNGFTEKQDKLGTVGLWCALHGEATLQAGMHHLEAQFDWHALVEQLERDGGIKTMAPFTTFPYLRQAFTEGERWSVRPERIDALLKRGMITREQADKFRAEGAIGSHLENLERNDGFKGFNQKGVSDIIARTDPRRQGQPVAAAAHH